MTVDPFARPTDEDRARWRRAVTDGLVPVIRRPRQRGRSPLHVPLDDVIREFAPELLDDDAPDAQ